METIRYDVKAPDLRGKTNEQQALAIEEYVRETTRQMGIILRQIKAAVDMCENEIEKLKQDQGGDDNGQ